MKKRIRLVKSSYFGQRSSRFLGALLLVAISIFSEQSFAEDQDFYLQSKMRSHNWNSSKRFKGTGVTKALYEIKRAQKKNQYAKCLQKINTYRSQLEDFKYWLRAFELHCATEVFKRTHSKKTFIKKLDAILIDTEANKKLFFTDSHGEKVLKNYTNTYVYLLRYHSARNIQDAWVLAQRMLKQEEYFLEKRKVDVYAILSGVALKAKQREASINLLKKSLEAHPTRLHLRIYKKLTGRVFVKPALKSAEHISWVEKQRVRAVKRLMRKQKYTPARRLIKVYIKKSRKPLGELYFLRSMASYYSERYAEAKKYFQEVQKKFSGSEWADTASFYEGMIHLRTQEPKLAQKIFEKNLSDNEDSKYRMQTLYWLWRSYQKEKDDRSDDIVDILLREYPLTYYGLRARAEKNKNKVTQFKKGELVITLDLSEAQIRSYARYKIFLKSRWLKEAKSEAAFITKGEDVSHLLVRSHLLGLANNAFASMEAANQSWDLDSDSISMTTLPLGFPRYYWRSVQKYARRYKVNPYFVLAIIRQESGFRRRAVSPARAHGLMQILTHTARESARKVRRRLRFPHSLYDPDTNILLGVSYLKRMIRAFDQHNLLALASYNAGIGNIRRWQRVRSLKIPRTSQPFDEMWIDELPWGETQFYIKAILRNYLLYKVIYTGEFRLEEPIWK